MYYAEKNTQSLMCVNESKQNFENESMCYMSEDKKR